MRMEQEIKESVTLKFSELARKKNAKKEKIISLGIGEPTFKTPNDIVKATHEALDNGYTKYSNPLGIVELRSAISEKLLKENNIRTSMENIIVTPGAKNAFFLALMAILEPGDEVINITPSYVSYIPQIKIAEPTALIHNIDLKKDDLTPDWEKLSRIFFERKIKALIINSPHNPTGKMLTEEDLTKMVDMAKRNNTYVISDEVYEKLNFSGCEHKSIGSIKDIEDKVITINGFSKAYSMTGWRIGYLSANKEISRRVHLLQQHINTNTCTFIQKGSLAAFSKSSESIIKKYNTQLAHNAALLVSTINNVAGLKVVSPEGGLFSFINISGTRMGSDAFAYGLLSEKSVALIPGVSFGKNWDDHVRVSLATSPDEFEKGIKLMSEFAKEAK